MPITNKSAIKLIYTTKEGIDTFPINPYSIYFITDDNVIQYDSPENKRQCIRLLKVFETEKQRIEYQNPIQGYGYLVKESNELWYYDINGWRTVSMNDLLCSVAELPDKRVNLDLTHEEILSNECHRAMYDIHIAKDTRQLIIDMVTTYQTHESDINDDMCMVSDEPYVIYETETERLAVDTNGFTKTIQSYVKATNRFWLWFPTTGKWKYMSHTPRTLTFSDPGPVTKTLGSGSFTNAATPGAGGGTIAYSSSVQTVATVDSNGAVTLVAAGQTTITATIAADANYASATASYILTVNAANQPQTAPTAPTLASRTTSSITLNTIAANTNGAAAQYSRNSGATWQDSPDFTGLTAGTSYTFVAQYKAVNGYDASPNSASASFSTESGGNNNNNGGSDSSDSGSGGSSGGGGTTSTTTAPVTTWLEQSAAGTLASAAKNRGENYVRTRSTGEYGVRGNAWTKLAGLQYQHDTVADGAVQVRLSISDPAKLTADSLVSGSVKGSEVDWVKSHFEKWFKNKLRMIHLDRQGDFGQPVQIAARVDLTGIDTKKLVFYAYDKKTNSYKRIEKPAYWIDENGYIHFTTEYAGDIVISEGALTKK